MRTVFMLTAFFIAFLNPGNAQAQPKTHMGILSLHFVFEFGGKPIRFGDSYKTAGGDSIRFDQVRFYAGSIAAATADGRPPEVNDIDPYVLIDSKDPASLQVQLQVMAPDSITGIRFYIGVDSLNQVRGARSGALDPLKGMYWTWNSGYVAVKIEGNSASASAAGGQVEYHLGGYRSPYAVRTLIILDAPKIITLPDNGIIDVVVPVDLTHFFPGSFSIKKKPALMTPGPEAKQFMTLFKNCFLPLQPGKPGS